MKSFTHLIADNVPPTLCGTFRCAEGEVAQSWHSGVDCPKCLLKMYPLGELFSSTGVEMLKFTQQGGTRQKP